jgi:hypothetical protein
LLAKERRIERSMRRSCFVRTQWMEGHEAQSDDRVNTGSRLSDVKSMSAAWAASRAVANMALTQLKGSFHRDP